MSGITGIFRRDGKDVDPADIKKMNDKISHRGPDGSRVWCEGPVAFGHQMLHTTQESLHETLPFEDKESGLVITADARIDNRKDLAPLLGIEDNEYVSDSYFILKAYEKWGEKCLEELLGDFAFAIWDKNKERLFCARDHMGVKPFYYYKLDEGFFFASEIKSIMRVTTELVNLNELKIALYLKNVRTDDKLTFYNNILSLTSAHFLTVDDVCDSKNRYWKLDPGKEIILDSEEEYINTFFDIFREAVKCRLRCAFPIGFDLSGGLDSTSIVGMANYLYNNKKVSSRKINTFSQIYDKYHESDERFYIKKAINTMPIEPHLIKCDNISPLDNIDSLLDFQDQPFHKPFIPILMKLFGEMEKNSVRVHLSGNGGDVIISHGEGYFLELFSKFEWKKLTNEMRLFSKIRNVSFFSLIIKEIFFPLIPESIKRILNPVWLFVRNFIHPKKDIIIGIPPNFLNEDFGKRMNISNYSNEGIWKSRKRSNAAKTEHYNSIFTIKDQQDFEIMSHAAAPFSIESRFPYYDIRLIEFCYGIPSEMKFKQGWDRFIQRVAMEKILPHKIRWRSDKANLIPLLKVNLFSLEKDLVEKTIYNESEIIEDYVDLDVIKGIYNDYIKTNSIAYTHSYNIWSSIVLILWMQKYFYNKIN